MFNRPLSARIVPLLLIVTGEVPALMLVMPPCANVSARSVIEPAGSAARNQNSFPAASPMSLD